MRVLFSLVALVWVALLLQVGPLAAQESTRPAATQQVEEEILPPILIVTVVEKPSVAILPKRVKPEFKTPLFVERSFERELREVPSGLTGFQEELESAKKIKRLQKLIARQKK
ncbi:MAG: hypothetical protein QHJ34_05725 [bacterium]|jgi:hypothetical protein|nr:hypothetical protein [candidate division KSB1 bacterium]MDH7559718.1 hypothetical protein [bacterium]